MMSKIEIKLTPRRAEALARYIRKTPQSVRKHWTIDFWGEKRGRH